MRRWTGLLALLALTGSLAACSGSSPAAEPSPGASPAPVAVRLPSKLLGLDVKEEDISSDVKRIRDSYLDSVALFGFRKKKLLRGTLEVGHFNSLARLGSADFRARIVAQVGSTVPQELRLGRMPVFMSAGDQQYSFLWFSGRWMYVLTLRRDYPFVRTMLRRLVEESARI